MWMLVEDLEREAAKRDELVHWYVSVIRQGGSIANDARVQLGNCNAFLREAVERMLP
jgi:hypothetical protein